jgi:hypothetical protein
VVKDGCFCCRPPRVWGTLLVAAPWFVVFLSTCPGDADAISVHLDTTAGTRWRERQP